MGLMRSTRFWLENLKERDPLEETGLDGMDINKVKCGNMDLIHIYQHMMQR
jgi:hypothetical protein